MTLLQCQNLSKTYGNEFTAVHAVNDVSYAFQENTFYSIIGKSGSGKSTLLQLLAGFLKPTEGSVLYQGKNINAFQEKEQSDYRAKQIGFIYQDFRLLPELTASENIQLPLILKEKKVDQTSFYDLTDTLDITKELSRYPNELSGGQQQRIAIARALIAHPKIVLADEPTGNLDKATAAMVLDCLLKVQLKYHATLILVTHDLDMARCANEVLHLEDGRLL